MTIDAFLMLRKPNVQFNDLGKLFGAKGKETLEQIGSFNCVIKQDGLFERDLELAVMPYRYPLNTNRAA